MPTALLGHYFPPFAKWLATDPCPAISSQLQGRASEHLKCGCATCSTKENPQLSELYRSQFKKAAYLLVLPEPCRETGRPRGWAALNNCLPSNLKESL